MRANHRREGNGQTLRSARSERGIALPIVLLAVAVLGVLTIISVQVSQLESSAGGGSLNTTKAFYTAEAGLHSVIASWDSARYDTMTALADAGDSLSLGKQLIPENGQVYHPMIHHLGDSVSKQYRITSQAWDPAASQWGRRVGVTVGWTQSTGFALVSHLNVQVIQGRVTGGVHANDNVMLYDQVIGDARAHGTVSPHSMVSGTVTEGVQELNLSTAACPVEGIAPDSTLPIDADPVFGPATTYGPAPVSPDIMFDPVSGDFGIYGDGDVSLSGTYYFHDFKKEGNGDFIVTPGSPVEIYVSGSLHIAGAGSINRDGSAADFKIYACGGETGPWVLDGSGSSSLRVEAWQHPLTLQGTSDWYGEFIGDGVVKQGSGKVFYDGPAGGSSLTGFRPIPGTWVDLTGTFSTTDAPIDADPMSP